AIKDPNCIFIEGDILDKEKLYFVFKQNRFDAVFHFAANSDIEKSSKNPDIDFNNTFKTTYNILNMMREFNVKKIVFASSSAIYGKTTEKISEDYAPLFPISHYGAAKLASEAFISSFAENYGIQCWITRFPNVTGERATHGVIFDFINKLKKNPKELTVLGNGEQNKPYLYVGELIDAILFVFKNSNEKINYFNIGTSSRTKVKDIAKTVINTMNLSAKINYTGGETGWIGDVKEFSYDLSKINNLGWKSKMSSDEAIQKSIQHILENNKCKQ
ncbi:MAG: NAD-dependent epimerase/dehydratase family protein, partial [Candidatus Gastranaerophilales bacterium]|nr:NAD-dependent epimerase/dehydratase family protein [Candidatus Gastranaerophilales bacterium]